MNKKYIHGVIVVEGRHDVARLSSLYESCYVVTNGYEVPEVEHYFLKSLNNDVPVYVVTDNDEAGEIIRKKVNAIRDGFINIKISAPESSKKKGIAECRNVDIQKEMDKYISTKPNINIEELNISEIFGSNNAKKLREILTYKFNLGLFNRNNLLSRVSLLRLSSKEINKEIENAKSR